MSFVQFYNPDWLRGFGTGVLNGSLWSIPVELQYYVLLPFLIGSTEYWARKISQFQGPRFLAFWPRLASETCWQGARPPCWAS